MSWAQSQSQTKSLNIQVNDTIIKDLIYFGGNKNIAGGNQIAAYHLEVILRVLVKSLKYVYFHTLQETVQNRKKCIRNKKDTYI